MTILGKKQMSEEDIKLNYITPVILKGWKGRITMETKITDGRINIRGNIVARSKPKFADYMLYLNDGKPIAVVEAKDNNHSVSHGLQQAMTYAQMMDLPFAYSSNGDAFYEHDFLTGQEQQIDLDKFPTQDELVARYYAELNGGKGVSDLEKKIVSQPYYSSQSTYPPRYYQRNYFMCDLILERRVNEVLWLKYADQHRGFVQIYGLENNDNFLCGKQEKCANCGIKNYGTPLYPIYYSDTPYDATKFAKFVMLRKIAETTATQIPPELYAGMGSALWEQERTTLIKKECHKYDEEWRMITGCIMKPPVMMEWIPSGIILGLRMGVAEENLVVSMAKEAGIKNIYKSYINVQNKLDAYPLKL